jgi:hypothetical protein
MDYNIVWKTVTAQFLNTSMVAFLVKVIPIMSFLNEPAKSRGEDFDASVLTNIWGTQGLFNMVFLLF